MSKTIVLNKQQSLVLSGDFIAEVSYDSIENSKGVCIEINNKRYWINAGTSKEVALKLKDALCDFLSRDDNSPALFNAKEHAETLNEVYNSK